MSNSNGNAKAIKSYQGFEEKTYAARKGRICFIKKIHFEMHPPSVTVQMMDTDSEVGTEFDRLQHIGSWFCDTCSAENKDINASKCFFCKFDRSYKEKITIKSTEEQEKEEQEEQKEIKQQESKPIPTPKSQSQSEPEPEPEPKPEPAHVEEPEESEYSDTSEPDDNDIETEEDEAEYEDEDEGDAEEEEPEYVYEDPRDQFRGNYYGRRNKRNYFDQGNYFNHGNYFPFSSFWQ